MTALSTQLLQLRLPSQVHSIDLRNHNLLINLRPSFLSMNMVPLTLLLAVCFVVASTSGVSNLLNVRTSYQRSSVEMNHNGNGDCFEESVVQETMRSLGVCLKGCHQLHFPSSNDRPQNEDDEYIDVGMNATTTHKSTSLKPAKNSTTTVVMITILWILMLGSGVKLHQVFLFLCIFLFSSTLDVNVMIGFVAAGFLHLLRGMWGQDSDIDDYDEFYGYYGDDDSASFSVELGGKKFTWQEKRSAF